MSQEWSVYLGIARCLKDLGEGCEICPQHSGRPVYLVPLDRLFKRWSVWNCEGDFWAVSVLQEGPEGEELIFDEVLLLPTPRCYALAGEGIPTGQEVADEIMAEIQKIETYLTNKVSGPELNEPSLV